MLRLNITNWQVTKSYLAPHLCKQRFLYNAIDSVVKHGCLFLVKVCIVRFLKQKLLCDVLPTARIFVFRSVLNRKLRTCVQFYSYTVGMTLE